ncbi:RNA polymerase sigma factor [Sphingomonadaceae bacterium jetA1]|jgi:RNA polymerase sigma-70 factor (ECF subfamily)|uniref:RNA polymerase sigma factor n=1 Tax=Facivitalis istanbulensis TaxID=3075838 RepID=UPI00347EEF46
MADKALSRLYAVHWRGIRAYLNSRLGNPAMADDLAQETFLRMVEGGAGNMIVNGRAWLYRTAHNLAVDHHRQEARRRTDALDGEQLAAIADDSPRQDDVAAARDALDQLRHTLEELPERTQQVFVAVRIDGLTYAQAAKRLGISDSSVQKHLARAVHHVMRHARPL